MLKNIWCAIFHRSYIHRVSAAGDWKRMRCDKCNVDWDEPR